MRSSALLLAVLVALVGCGKDKVETQAKSKTDTPAAPSSAVSVDQPVPAAPAADAAPAPAPVATGPISTSTLQLVVSIADGWDSQTVRITRFARDEGGPWKKVGASFDAAIGSAGLGWGVGLHPNVRKEGEPIKMEGDRRSPAGLFRIGGSYGYAEQAPVPRMGIAYTHSRDSLRCVDDADSVYYNSIIDAAKVDKDWTSAELMKAKHPLYEMLITIGHNELVPVAPPQPQPTPGAGSCVFFHLWRKLEKPTIGCTAMSKDHLVELMGWLNSMDEPKTLFLTRDRYLELQSEWALPSL